ncbi:MAG: hypothetical protein EOP46_01120 [Sphingobacteriaceae bacterium]|nr:MAG: hypothetical protein EOP46_01120 [Sphingobacteriaceae bacterium]
MHQLICTRETAEAANYNFEIEVHWFLRNWIFQHESETLLRFDQSLDDYLSNNALRDFFLHSVHPLKQLLQQNSIACHLERGADEVYFDPTSGDPLLAQAEQRIYNLAHRMDSERMHVPFRSVQPAKQTEAGDTANIATYPADSESIRYNSGNHFTSRPANGNVFDENSKQCIAKSAGNLSVVFERGFLEDRLLDIKQRMIALHEAGAQGYQYFVICSRHSPQEGHFGASLVIMDPSNPHFPVRVFVCDTLLKDLPHHPRWWNHFIAEYANVFGEAIGEVIEDLSHPLQKVNVKGDPPYRHDWDCPYYVTSMTKALADIVMTNPDLIVNGSLNEVYNAMKTLMQDYYQPDQTIKDRQDIKEINRLKRWSSGSEVIRNLLSDVTSNSSC